MLYVKQLKEKLLCCCIYMHNKFSDDDMLSKFDFRPFITNLLPCLARICARAEEAVQVQYPVVLETQ
jgi:hypothetical protein